MRGQAGRTCIRLFVVVYCWVTAMYAFIASSAFAYQQFLRPRVFEWVGAFSDWHAVVSWAWLSCVCGVLWGDLWRGTARGPARLLLVGSAVLAVWNAASPVLPRLGDSVLSGVVGGLALVPVLWLAALDHARFPWRATRAREVAAAEGEGRLFAVAVAAALFAWTLYAVFASVALAGAFEPDLMTAGIAVGLISSLLVHLVIAVVAFLVCALIGHMARGSFVFEYVLLLAALVVVLAMAFDRFIGNAIGLTGASRAIASVGVAASIVGVWTGARLRGLAERPAEGLRAMGVLFGVSPGGTRSSTMSLQLAGVTAVALALGFASRQYDWDFLVLKSGVVAVWLLAFGAMYRMVPIFGGDRTVAIAAVCMVVLACHGVAAAALPRRALDRYIIYNASFRVANDLLRSAPPMTGFDRYLREHSGFTDVDVPPIDISPVQTNAGLLAPAPSGSAPPLIFLFVIDSLRQDYLSPYNPGVGFTPRLAAFASDSLVFSNAYTRYGGTGLSMPAIWAGSALLHKQYVRPFAPMNALDTLLDANGYTKLLSLDHITQELLGPARSVVQLDSGVREMDFDFCRTLAEVTERLGDGSVRRPIFAHTRSLNLHVAAVRYGEVQPGESFPGFHAPYASRVSRIDGCFGRFLDMLETRGLYDNSLIIVTSDHGERLGEDGQWGHSYHMTPEVIQIPLIMHLPVRPQPIDVDREAVALSTDIVPTIYATLGYSVRDSDGLIGRSLIGSPSSSQAARQADHVLAASYGAVYAVLRRNGRALYIADAVNSHDHAYRRSGAQWVPIDVSEDMRTVNRFLIRGHVDRVARAYGLASKQ